MGLWVGLLAGSGGLWAQVAADEASEFLGDWVIQVQSERGTTPSLLSFREEAGNLVADLYVRRLADETLEDLERTETGIRLKWNAELQGTTLPMTIDLDRDGEGLVGKLNADFFQADITGMTQAAAEELNIRVVRSSDGDRDDIGLVRLEQGAGLVRLRFDRVETAVPAYLGLSQLSEGQVVRFLEAKPLKIWFDSPIRFGDVTVPVGNHGETYPGVYSLWLKRVGDGWNLVFNNLADAWGTQHFSAEDVAEVVLESSEASEPAERMTAQLEAAEGGGQISIAWGKHLWRVRFENVEG